MDSASWDTVHNNACGPPFFFFFFNVGSIEFWNKKDEELIERNVLYIHSSNFARCMYIDIRRKLEYI